MLHKEDGVRQKKKVSREDQGVAHKVREKALEGFNLLTAITHEKYRSPLKSDLPGFAEQI